MGRGRDKGHPPTTCCPVGPLNSCLCVGEWVTIAFRAILKLLCPWNVIREPANEVAFQRSKRKTGNNEPHLTDAARKRTERIKELEDQLAQFESQVAHLKQETARKAFERARELEVVAAQRADLLKEKDKELADVREALTQRSVRIQELERTLAEIDRK